MARAEVGDDVFGEDPTVRALEEEIAGVTGKEAALFVPSGTMSNQLAIATQTRPGDDVIVGEGAHPLSHEAGAAAAVSGVQLTVAGRGGLFSAEDMEAVVQSPSEWSPRSALVAIENTHNRAGGRVWPESQARRVAERARELNLGSHVDGARIWNASVASSIDVATLCAPFDTASVCFSKGLGAPVGSALCGPRDLIVGARRFRKRWGGGMRQAGILAAGALYALRHHRDRLVEDHANARAFAQAMARVEWAHVDLETVQTNLVHVDVDLPAAAIANRARSFGLLVGASGPRRLRIVTHLDVSAAQVESATELLIKAMAAVAAERRGSQETRPETEGERGR